MTKKKKRSNKKTVFMCVFSLVVICFTTYTISKYWFDIYKKYKESKNLEITLKKLKKKEEALKADVNKMQDADYIARYAREKYLYSKDGEFILNIK